jgi:phosphate transport system substrate-binding protein
MMGARCIFALIACAFSAAALARVERTTPPGWPEPKDHGERKITVDARIPDYKSVPLLSGKVRSVGSSTLTNLLNRWVDAFKLIYPGVEFDVVGGGSGIAAPALLSGQAELAPMSRPMNAKEIEDFKKKFSHAPTRITVALDAIAVYVNKYNPIEVLTLKQLDGIFSISHKRGSKEIKTWGQLGAQGEWQDKEIIIKSPARTHGMYTVFREMVLDNGDYRYDMRAEPVSSSIVQGIGAEPTAIGFASYFYHTRRTRPLAVAANDGAPAFPPTQQNCLEGKYPLARFLYVYVNKKPDAPLSPMATQFLAFICSKQGQETAAHEGNYPLNADVLAKECSNYLR